MREIRLPPEPDFIVADAHFYRVKARQCAGMAYRARNPEESETLRNMAGAFEEKARGLDR